MNSNVKKSNPFARLVAAVAACVSRFSGNGKPAHQREAKPNMYMKIRNVPDQTDYLIEKKQLHVEGIDWRWHNQRQIRKDRRRAHAAGVRHAFR